MNVHTGSGALGVLLFFITQSFILILPIWGVKTHIAFYVGLFSSAVFCLYCSCVWFYIKVKPRFKEALIGNFIFGILIFGVISYLVDGYSGVFVNDFFCKLVVWH